MRHVLPTRDRTGFTATQVKDDYAKAYPEAIAEIAAEYGTKITVMRKVKGFGKYSKTFQEKAIFDFMADVVFHDGDTSREYGPTDGSAGIVYAPKTTLDALAAKDPRFTVRAGDVLIIYKNLYKLDSKKPQGSFLSARGAIQFSITIV